MAKQQTVTIEGTSAPVIHCTARKSFDFGGQHIPAGTSFYLVRSASQLNQYHLVAWSASWHCWSCSCGAHAKKHAHTKAVNAWIVDHVVSSQKKVVQPVISTGVQEKQASTMTNKAVENESLVSSPIEAQQKDVARLSEALRANRKNSAPFFPCKGTLNGSNQGFSLMR